MEASIANARALERGYLEFLMNGFSAQEGRAGAIEICTPYLDRHNDCISAWALDQGERWKLTDGGYTIRDLMADDLNLLQRGARNDLLLKILASSDAALEGEEIVMYIGKEQGREAAAFKAHVFFKVLSTVDDMFMLSRPMVRSAFCDDVRAWLAENRRCFREGQSLTGASGYAHKIDFVSMKPDGRDFGWILPIDRVTKDAVTSLLFKLSDLQEKRKWVQSYAVVNDESGQEIRSAEITAMKNFNVKVLGWSQRKDWISEFPAAA